MRLHICTEDPCPVRDHESWEILQNGFKTSYTPTGDGVPLFSGVHPPGFWEKLEKALPNLINRLRGKK